MAAPSNAERPVRTVADAAMLGTVLGVWAHPDDETYLSAGLTALARDAGHRRPLLGRRRPQLEGVGSAGPAVLVPVPCHGDVAPPR